MYLEITTRILINLLLALWAFSTIKKLFLDSKACNELKKENTKLKQELTSRGINYEQ